MAFLDRFKPKPTQAIEPSVDKPMLGELGRATSTDLFQCWKLPRYNPDELITAKGWGILDQMQRDPQVKAAIKTKKYAVLMKPYRIVPASDEPRDKEIADFITWALQEVDGRLEGVLYEGVLDAIAKGYSISEKVWDVVPSGKYKGMWYLKAIKPKDPSNFTFDVDDYYNITQLLLSLPTGDTMISMPVDKFVVYTYESVYGGPWGTSDLRAAYRSWWCKDYIIKWWQLFIEKYAMPTLVGYYKNGIPPDKQQDLLRILSKIESDTAIIVPEDISDQIKEIFSQKDPRVTYVEAVNYHDAQIAKAILGETLTLDTPKGKSSGSYNMASIHQDTLYYQLQRIKADIEDRVIGKQVIRQLVDFNFGPGDYPKLQFEPLKDADLEALADSVWKLVGVGVLSPEEQWIRDRMGYPKREDGARSVMEIKADNDMEALKANKMYEVGNDNSSGTGDTGSKD